MLIIETGKRTDILTGRQADWQTHSHTHRRTVVGMAIGKATPISLIVVLLALAATSTHGQIAKTCGSGACCKEEDLIATETSDDATINAIQLKQYAYVSQADSAVNDTCYGMVHLKEFGSGHMILAFKAKETLCGNGLFLPIFPGEIMWSRALRKF